MLKEKWVLTRLFQTKYVVALLNQACLNKAQNIKKILNSIKILKLLKSTKVFTWFWIYKMGAQLQEHRECDEERLYWSLQHWLGHSFSTDFDLPSALTWRILTVLDLRSHTISYMKWKFSYMKLKFHLWNLNLICEMAISHMKFPYMKSNHICDLQFIYEMCNFIYELKISHV